MNEWIIAPLLEPDPTGVVSHTPGGGDSAGVDGTAPEETGGDRRHGDRRDDHDADPDFGRGEDRRDDAA